MVEQNIYTLRRPEQGGHRLVQVTRQVLQSESVRGARTLAVAAQVDCDHTPIVVREPRADPPPGARRGRNSVYEDRERVALLAPAFEG